MTIQREPSIPGYYVIKSVFITAPIPIFGPQGHIPTLIGNDTDGWEYDSKNGNAGPNDAGVHYNSLSDFEKAQPEYTEGYRIPTSNAADQAMKDYIKKNLGTPYDGLKNNCSNLVQGTLQAGGLNVPDSGSSLCRGGQIPYYQFDNIQSANPGELMRLLVDPPVESKHQRKPHKLFQQRQELGNSQ